MKVRVHQNAVPRPQILHHVELEALSFEYCSGVSWEEIIFISLLIHPRKETTEKKWMMVNAEFFLRYKPRSTAEIR